MGKANTKVTLRVLQVNPASGSEVTEYDKDGNVTGIEQQVYEDVRLGVTNVETGSQEGGGRLVSGELVLSLPAGELSVGDTFEADLSAKSESSGTAGPTTATEGSTLRQDREEVERGRKPDGSLGSKGKSGGSPGSSSAG